MSEKPGSSKIRVQLNLQSCGGRNGFATYQTEISSRLAQYKDLEITASYFSLIPKNTKRFSFPVRQIFFPQSLAFEYMRSMRTAAIPAVKFLRPLFSCNALMRGDSDDVYIFFENKIPSIRLSGKIIAVIHDIIPLRLHSTTKRGMLNFAINSRNIQEILSRAAKIITVSEFSKSDILDYFGLDDDGKIEVVYNGVDAEYFSQSYDCGLLREKYKLPEKYILYFGQCAPRKNLPSLIKAVSLLPESLRKEYKLVITNPQPYVIKFTQELGMSDSVHYISKVPEYDRPGIYQMASLVVLPSLYEGFGLQIVEGQAAGVPVLCSNVTSMPEVAGDAAVLVDPNDAVDISRGIERGLTDNNLRSELVAGGYRNIKRFTWEKSAEKFRGIIMNL